MFEELRHNIENLLVHNVNSVAFGDAFFSQDDAYGKTNCIMHAAN